MDKNKFILLLLLLSITLVSSSDIQTTISFTGDNELTSNYLGDINLSFLPGDSITPLVDIHSPSSGTTYSNSNTLFNITTNKHANCNYSIDAGTTNSSMTPNILNREFSATRTIPNGNYIVYFYCTDIFGNSNNNESASFVVSVASTDATTSSSGGGGSGGMPIILKENINFKIDSESFKVRSIVGDSKNREFKIKNYGNDTIKITINVEGEEFESMNGEMLTFDKMIILDRENVNLDAGEEKKIQFKIIAPDNLGTFVGKIILKVQDVTKEILINVNTQSKETLFDVSSAILNEEITDGEKVKVQIDLLPIGEKGVDVTLKYLIKDYTGKIYYEESGTFYVDSQMSFIKEFPTDKLLPRHYTLATEMVYLGGFASASSQFEVIDNLTFDDFELNIEIILLISILTIIIGIIIKTMKLEKNKKV